MQLAPALTREVAPMSTREVAPMSTREVFKELLKKVKEDPDNSHLIILASLKELKDHDNLLIICKQLEGNSIILDLLHNIDISERVNSQNIFDNLTPYNIIFFIIKMAGSSINYFHIYSSIRIKEKYKQILNNLNNGAMLLLLYFYPCYLTFEGLNYNKILITDLIECSNINFINSLFNYYIKSHKLTDYIVSTFLKRSGSLYCDLPQRYHTFEWSRIALQHGGINEVLSIHIKDPNFVSLEEIKLCVKDNLRLIRHISSIYRYNKDFYIWILNTLKSSPENSWRHFCELYEFSGLDFKLLPINYSFFCAYEDFQYEILPKCIFSNSAFYIYILNYGSDKLIKKLFNYIPVIISHDPTKIMFIIKISQLFEKKGFVFSKYYNKLQIMRWSTNKKTAFIESPPYCELVYSGYIHRLEMTRFLEEENTYALFHHYEYDGYKSGGVIAYERFAEEYNRKKRGSAYIITKSYRRLFKKTIPEELLKHIYSFLLYPVFIDLIDLFKKQFNYI